MMAVSICSPILRTIARHRCGRWSSDLGHSRCQGRSRSAGRIVRWVLTPAAAGKRSAPFGYADPILRQARQRRSLSPSGPPAPAELGPGRDLVHPQRRPHWPAGSAQAGSSAHSAELSFVGAGSAAPPGPRSVLGRALVRAAGAIFLTRLGLAAGRGLTSTPERKF